MHSVYENTGEIRNKEHLNLDVSCFYNCFYGKVGLIDNDFSTEYSVDRRANFLDIEFKKIKQEDYDENYDIHENLKICGQYIHLTHKTMSHDSQCSILVYAWWDGKFKREISGKIKECLNIRGYHLFKKDKYKEKAFYWKQVTTDFDGFCDLLKKWDSHCYNRPNPRLKDMKIGRYDTTHNDITYT